MCNPVAAIAAAQFAASAGQKLLAYKGQQTQFQQNTASAIRGYADDYSALTAREDQVGRAASESIFDDEIQALRARGTALASAAGTGLAGVSIREVLQGVNVEKNRSVSIKQLNRDNEFAQIGREKVSAAATAQNRINSVAKPSKLGLAFGLAGDAINAGSWYYGKKTGK